MFSENLELLKEYDELMNNENMEEMDIYSFSDRDERDGYFYHVTTKDRIDNIVYEGEGLVPNKDPQFYGAAPSSHSKGKIFITERDGVSTWIYELANQLEYSKDYMEDENAEDDIAVIRIPKHLVKNIKDDNLLSPATKGRDYYTTEHIPSST
jgi:hypothetical protein